MVRFYCDRCETEVEGQQDLIAFTADVAEETMAPFHTRRELCSKCLEETKEILNKFFAKPQAKPRRSA